MVVAVFPSAVTSWPLVGAVMASKPSTCAMAELMSAIKAAAVTVNCILFIVWLLVRIGIRQRRLWTVE